MKKNWKADEMEMAINYQAMRLSWLFVGITLLIYCIVSYILDGIFPFIPFMILLTQTMIFFAGKLWITNRLAGENNKVNQENEE